jgi:thioredoxin-related protein
MKTIKNLLASLLILILFSANTFSDGFVLNSLIEAQTISEATKKPILLIFGADSCRFCSLLKNDLDSTLKKDIDNFIVCYLDLKIDPALKEKYNVTLIPDSRIIQDDKTISIIKGYKTQDYKQWLKNVK